MRARWIAVLALVVGACGGDPRGTPEEFQIPSGATFQAVIDTLEAHGIIGAPGRFALYARMKGADHEIRAGRYSLRRGEAWSEIVATLTEGRMLTESMTIPEGFRLKQMAGPIARITDQDSVAVLSVLGDSTATERWTVPGPTLEGYLFADTYRFAPGVDVARARPQRAPIGVEGFVLVAELVVEAADRLGIPMLFTGVRHFRH